MGTGLWLHVLATGSKGNCSVVEDASTGRCTVIDCGVCNRDFAGRCAEAGVDVSKVEAVLVTHSHSDHTSGLGVVLRGLARQGCRPVVYADPVTVSESSPLQKVAGEGFRIEPIEAGKTIEAAGMDILPFPTSHDTRVSYGFRVECGGDALGFMTDTGIVTPEAEEALRRCRILAVEANHDLGMLADGPYPAWLKQRISGKGGHLSNNQCAELVQGLSWDGLEHVVAMHASEVNNTYDLALEAVADALREAGSPAGPHVGFQHGRVSVR